MAVGTNRNRHFYSSQVVAYGSVSVYGCKRRPYMIIFVQRSIANNKLWLAGTGRQATTL